MKKYLSIFIILFTQNSFASSKKYFENKVHYRTTFGSCPAKTVGRLTLSLIKVFEINNSLLDVKKEIIKDKLKEKYYLSSYNVSYNPLQKMLRFDFDCPKPMMKVQIYKKDGEEFYTAILVDNGKLYDPTYEVLLRTEKKLKRKLPHLAIPVTLLNGDVHKKLTSLFNELEESFVKNISEVIISEKKDLTLILSAGRKPTSAFLGNDYWREKVGKLSRIMGHMKKKKTIPAVINLTNAKKIVVKFSDTI